MKDKLKHFTKKIATIKPFHLSIGLLACLTVSFSGIAIYKDNVNNKQQDTINNFSKVESSYQKTIDSYQVIVSDREDTEESYQKRIDTVNSYSNIVEIDRDKKKSENTSLNKKVKELETTQNSLNEKVKSLDESNKKLKEEKDTLDKSMKDLEEKLASKENETQPDVPAVEQQAQEEPSVAESAQTMVYVVPNSGTKYHNHVHGKGDFTQISLEDAQNQGYSPCKICFGN